jgi:hypothetical protein
MIGHGAFADVIRRTDNTVVKIFRRQIVTHDPPLVPADNDVVIRATWDEECGCYELLASHPALEKYAAKYFGRVSVTEVLDERGESVLSDYVPDCAFELELVPGVAEKIRNLSENWLNLADSVFDRFATIGILKSYDGCAFVPGTRAELTLVDFSPMVRWTSLTDILADAGQLPQDIRERYRPS